MPRPRINQAGAVLPRVTSAVHAAAPSRYGLLDHFWGALLGLLVTAPLFGLAMAVLTGVRSTGVANGPGFGELLGTALFFAVALLLIGSVVVPLLGVPLGAGLSWLLSPVRHRWIHVLVFALAGAVLGVVGLPVAGMVLSGQLSWVSLAEVPGLLGSELGQLFIWPGALVAGLGRWLGMRSADRAARPGVQDRRECLLRAGESQ